MIAWKGFKRCCPVLVVCVVGLFAWSLSLKAAPSDKTRQPRPSAGKGAVSTLPSLVDLPMAPPVHAFRTETVLLREGNGLLSLSYGGDSRSSQGAVAGPPCVPPGCCRADFDCDDCNPCTTDICNIPAAVITGTCSNDPVATCGSCGDGVFCNGKEICDGIGGCLDATQGPCDALPDTICDELGGTNLDGECVTPCQDSGVCDDGLACTGVEVCVLQECVDGDNAGAPCSDDTPCTGVGGFCGGVCRSLGLPCGSLAGCAQVVCVGGPGPELGQPCSNDDQCDLGQTCQDTGVANCLVKGRCCTPDANGDFLECGRESKQGCDAVAGRWLNVGDDPAVDGDQGGCTFCAQEPRPNAGECFNCPLYAAGVVPPGPLIVPVGKVGAASCNSIQEIGDDYKIAGCTPGQDFVEVTTIRWVGGFQTEGLPGSVSRIRVTFYDQDGKFIEDTITNPAVGGAIRLRTVIYAEKPIVPCAGFMAIKAAVRFSGFGKHTWMSTDADGNLGPAAPVDVGTNDTGTLWMNGAPATTAQVAAALGNPDLTVGVLAFEIVGNVVNLEGARGACCDTTAGGCRLELPWICTVPGDPLIGDFFQGPGSKCNVCSNEFFRDCDTAADCPACESCPGAPNCENGDACDPDAQCPGGTCTAGTCAGGDNNGQACDPDIDCPGGTCVPDSALATCDLLRPACTLTACCVTNAPDDLICVGGDNPGAFCTVANQAADCPNGGTCTGSFSGVAVCNGGLNDGDPCTDVFDCPDGACTGTALPGDCVQVSGGFCSADGITECVSDDECVGVENVCVAPCPAGTVSEGFGTNCDPNCCDQPVLTGYDTCLEAALPGNLAIINVPPDQSPVTVTFSGNNLNATFGDFTGEPGNPGTCELAFAFDPESQNRDRGWWHAFSIDACANVRLDNCCSAERSGEIKQPQWAFVTSDCNPCTSLIGATIVGDEDVGGVGTREAAGDRGAPFCASDDLWETYGPLTAGIYYSPQFSGPEGTFGDYQLHITVRACPTQTCCLPEKMCVAADDSLAGVVDGVGAPTVCTTTTVCDAAFPGEGTTCKNCAVVNTLDCDAADGFWNGFGNLPAGVDPIASCLVGGGVCDLGSCCLGPGDCKDNAIGDCDPDEPNDPDCCDPAIPATCMTRGLCESLPGDNIFVGGARCDFPELPCPACLFQSDTNCQLPGLGPDLGLVYMSDLATQGINGVVTADDFIPQGEAISQICVWGAYLDPFLDLSPPAVSFECVGTVVDEFRVRVFLDGGVDADPNTPPDLPGTLVVGGESLVTGANIVMAPEKGTDLELTYDVVAQGYTLTLNTPITGLQSGVRHWLEVTNNTVEPADNTCVWHWLQHFPADRDAYCAVGISPGGLTGDSVYVNRSGRAGTDMSFCLDINFDSPEAPEAGCWPCEDSPLCVVETLTSCTGTTTNDDRLWDRSDPMCANPDPPVQDNDFCAAEAAGCPTPMPACGDGCVDPPGEECDDGNTIPGDGCDEFCQFEDLCAVVAPTGGAGALPIGDGLFGYDNACAENDGPSLIDGGPTQPVVAFGTDIWFAYTATCTGFAVFDQCPTQTGITQNGNVASDAIIALYHQADDPDTPVNESFICPCPGPIDAISPLQDGFGSDEGCNGIFDAGPGILKRNVKPGECWLIRVGGFASARGAAGQTGRGLLSVSCEEAFCLESEKPEPEKIDIDPDPVAEVLVESTKNRFLSFRAVDIGRSQAVRVTFVALPPPFTSWNGFTLWAGEPKAVSENAGTIEPAGAPADPTFQAATLQCDGPEGLFRDWNALGVVHLFHEGIVPGGVYQIQMMDVACDPVDPTSFSAPLDITQAKWGDTVENCATIPCPPPNGVTNIIDVLALVDKFVNAPTAIIKARAELVNTNANIGGCVNLKTDIIEVLRGVDALLTLPYPFAPSTPLDPCDSTCPNPLP